MYTVQGLRRLHKATFIIKSLYKWGAKRLCNALLKSQRLDAVDIDTVHEFERVLADAGLPTDVKSIGDDGDDDDDQTYEMPVEETDKAPTQPPSLPHLSHRMMTTTQFIRNLLSQISLLHLIIRHKFAYFHFT
jgi:hypothetical protein